MSFPFGSTSTSFVPSSVSIFHDEDGTSNIAVRKTKAVDMSKHPATKRAALGTITNHRVQPSRAVKQATSSDVGEFSQTDIAQTKLTKTVGAFSIPAVSQTFSIHIDSEPSTSSSLQTVEHKHISVSNQQNKLQIRPAVIRPPLASRAETIVIEDDPRISGSPMVLDTSVEDRRVPDTEESRHSVIVNVPEYSQDIYNHLRQSELKNRPKPAYMRKQPDITASMRSILVDWLVEVSEEYRLQRETLCLSVNYIDRFLSQMSVLRGKLQLVGTAAMFLASKFEEIYPPDVGEFVHITDETYTKQQVLRMEHLILKVLSFDIAVPTVNIFCEKFIKQCNVSDEVGHLTLYLAELTLIDADTFLKYLPSHIAAAAMCLANHTLEKDPWSATAVEVTGYHMEQLPQCVNDLHAMFCRASSHPQQAIREKYSSTKFSCVSSLCPPSTLPCHVVEREETVLTII